jgi:hypothetical protein
VPEPRQYCKLGHDGAQNVLIGSSRPWCMCMRYEEANVENYRGLRGSSAKRAGFPAPLEPCG